MAEKKAVYVSGESHKRLEKKKANSDDKVYIGDILDHLVLDNIDEEGETK